MRKLIVEPVEQIDGQLKAGKTFKEINKPDVHFVKKHESCTFEQLQDKQIDYYDKWTDAKYRDAIY